MKKIALLSLVASSVLMAGGYKIPENSLNGVALSAANIAHAKSADAAYYNPANMVFMINEQVMEADLTYIGLSAVNFSGTAGGVNDGININSKDENFLIPTLHYVSKEISGARFGFSMVVPGGLSKRWDDQPAVSKAEEFTLETIELNPTVALPIGDKIGVALGLRIVHTTGVVKITPAAGFVSQSMEGDSIDFGYNLALAYKPTSEVEIGLTYRSQVDLTTEGSADLVYLLGPVLNGNYDVSLTVPLPATLSIAAAYTLPSKTTVEFVYERNYWSAYKEINFNYSHATAEAVFGTAIPKNWKDTNAFRLGVTQELEKMTLMLGMVYDETPVPDESIGFELPDSDSLSVSIGSRFHISEKMEIGIAALYSMREDRTVDRADLQGEFTNSDVLMISTGINYKF